uniref:Family with sequence similarity 174 member B n=1 Tax=Pelusios castaneus TaxID=367368 RepID=A0A8C8R8Z9_9SAUR
MAFCCTQTNTATPKLAPSLEVFQVQLDKAWQGWFELGLLLPPLTLWGTRPGPPPGNHSGTQLSPAPGPALLRDLSALKAAVIGACGLSAGLVGCLLLRVCRSGKRIKKTRKYDIITTPAERVEMAPLNEDEDDDEDSTVFDVKYRY